MVLIIPINAPSGTSLRVHHTYAVMFNIYIISVSYCIHFSTHFVIYNYGRNPHILVSTWVGTTFHHTTDLVPEFP